MRWRLHLFILAAALLSVACTGTPSPLAPAIRGSIGVPHNGMITNAVALPKKGEGYALLRTNDRNWGNPRLVAAIQGAAKTVARARPGGARLMVGDISARWGGQASGHRSHRTGRDADLLIYVLTPDGRSIESPGFVRFGPDGLGEIEKGKFVRVDVAREWQLVKALVTSPEANVQWLFFARWLEALVIEYARARDEDPELIWHAESVLLQPGDSSAHDDHLHLRVACTPDEAIAGCLGGGPYWPWLPALPQFQSPSDGNLARALIGDLLPGNPVAPQARSAP
ncbi:MAG: penicillin-insensitive murein endopeptidase [Minicystis sp.]